MMVVMISVLLCCGEVVLRLLSGSIPASQNYGIVSVVRSLLSWFSNIYYGQTVFQELESKPPLLERFWDEEIMGKPGFSASESFDKRASFEN